MKKIHCDLCNHYRKGDCPYYRKPYDYCDRFDLDKTKVAGVVSSSLAAIEKLGRQFEEMSKAIEELTERIVGFEEKL